MPETCILPPVCLGAAIQLIDEGARDRERTMTEWGLTIGLAVAFFFSNPAWAGDPNAILSKKDSAQMFAMSEAQWILNVETLKASQIGDYRVAPTGEYTLYMRPDPSSGLLVVSPSYRTSNKSRPWKLSVTIIADTPAASLHYGAMSEDTIEDALQTAMRELTPEFSVMGYMVRDESEPPSIHFTIFRKNDFPAIDMVNEMGRVCPTEDGKKTCVRTRMMGSN